MHEYRTVEPEFESGDQGGFVLCRLFRKPEETISGLIRLDHENSEFSLTPTTSSPGSALHRADDLEGECSTPLNQVSPESSLPEELQPLPDTLSKQSVDIRLSGEAVHLVTYPAKPEESHCGSNMTSDASNHEGKGVGKQDAPLFDDLEEFLGPEHQHLFSDEFSLSNPAAPSSTRQEISYDANQGSYPQIQYPMSEQDSFTEFLDAILSTPEECSNDTPKHQINSITYVVHQGQSSMINQESDWISVIGKDTGSHVKPETLEAQGNLGLEVSAQSMLCFSQPFTLQMGTSNGDGNAETSMETACRSSRRKPHRNLKAKETEALPVHGVKPVEDLTDPINFMGDKINIRHRSRENFISTLAGSSYFPGQQGVAERRILLQSSKGVHVTNLLSVETAEVDEHASDQSSEKTRSSESADSSDHEHKYMVNFLSVEISEDDEHASDQSSEETESYISDNEHEYEIKFLCAETTEVSEHTSDQSNETTQTYIGDNEHKYAVNFASAETTEVKASDQSSENVEVSETDDDKQSTSDADGTASSESVSALSFEEHDEPTLRLRSRQVKDVDIKLENRSTQQKPPRVGSPSNHMVSLVVIVSLLCAGAAWFLNPWGS